MKGTAARRRSDSGRAAAAESAEERHRRDGPTTVRQIDLVIHRVEDGGFSVIDRGCGVPSDHAASVFQPFFSTKADGMGMGLNICRSIVEFHQGRLQVEPNPAGGSIFRFTLPLAVEPAAAENARLSKEVGT
jgi:signal transduction histidine kinase